MKAHDVRHLVVCARCKDLGDDRHMIPHDSGWLHGRCFVRRYGRAKLAALPRKQTGPLQLGDLGPRTMFWLLRQQQRRRDERGAP